MTFLVADGVTPSNEGRGYVLRRIIRRAVQQAQRIGLADVWRLPAVVVEQMGDAYPELRRDAEKIEREIKAEEARFEETLARGLERFEELAGQPGISADDAFALAATYGFPIELTVELAEERGQQVDVDGYRELMDRAPRGLQRSRRRVGTCDRGGAQRSSSATRRRRCSRRSRRWSRRQTGASAPSSTSPRSTQKAAARSRTSASSSTGDRRARRARQRGAGRRRPDAALRGRGLRRRRPRARRRVVEPPLPDDGEPHGDPSPPPGPPGRARATTYTRPARPSAPTSSASTSRTGRR